MGWKNIPFNPSWWGMGGFPPYSPDPKCFISAPNFPRFENKISCNFVHPICPLFEHSILGQGGLILSKYFSNFCGVYDVINLSSIFTYDVIEVEAPKKYDNEIVLQSRTFWYFFDGIGSETRKAKCVFQKLL